MKGMNHCGAIMTADDEGSILLITEQGESSAGKYYAFLMSFP